MTECMHKMYVRRKSLKAIFWVTCAVKAMQHHLLPKRVLLNERVFDS